MKRSRIERVVVCERRFVPAAEVMGSWLVEPDGRRTRLGEWSAAVGGPTALLEASDGGSLDAALSEYLDQLAGGDFDPEQYAADLVGLASRAQNVLPLERCVLRTGLSRVPADKRPEVERFLKLQHDASPDETPADRALRVQPKRADRAGPSS